MSWIILAALVYPVVVLNLWRYGNAKDRADYELRRLAWEEEHQHCMLYTCQHRIEGRCVRPKQQYTGRNGFMAFTFPVWVPFVVVGILVGVPLWYLRKAIMWYVNLPTKTERQIAEEQEQLEKEAELNELAKKLKLPANLDEVLDYANDPEKST